MTDQSKRIEEMLKYHRLAAKLDRGYKRLEAEANTFIAHVKACLPARKEQWWLVVFEETESEEIGGEEQALVRLKRGLMYEAVPMDLAFECAQKMENEATGRLQAKKALGSHVDALEWRARRILQERSAYQDLLTEEDRIKREGKPKWYDAVRKTRRAHKGSEIAPLVQVNKLQSALLNHIDQEVGFPESGAGSLGKGALQGLVTKNRPPAGGWPPEEKQSPAIPGIGEGDQGTGKSNSEKSLLEDATWVLYLSIASGDRVPGGPVKTEEDGWETVCDGSDLIRN